MWQQTKKSQKKNKRTLVDSINKEFKDELMKGKPLAKVNNDNDSVPTLHSSNLIKTNDEMHDEIVGETAIKTAYDKKWNKREHSELFYGMDLKHSWAEIFLKLNKTQKHNFWRFFKSLW